MHYDSFNYILTAFLNILPGDLRALPLEKKPTKTNPTKFLFQFFFSDSLVTHTPVLLCALCNLNKQFEHCRILKLCETKMKAILGHIQIVQIRAGTSKKKDFEIASKEAQLVQMSKLHFMQQMLRRELQILQFLLY